MTDSNGEIASQRERMGQILGLDRPVSDAVLFAALIDEEYARNLLVSRKSELFLKTLLANPPSVSRQTVGTQKDITFSNVDLIKKGVKALSNWAKTGFSIVDDDVLKTREDACLSCSNMIDPSRALQKIIPTKDKGIRVGERAGKKVCKLCGCGISKKIRLPSESCPDKDPANPALSRWGESLKEESAVA